MASKTPEMERLAKRGLTKISLQIASDLIKQIDEKAAKLETSRSLIIRDAIEDYLWRNR